VDALVSFFRVEKPIYIRGITHHFPDRVVTNDELIQWSEKKLRSSIISARTGIESRHWAAENEACSDLAIAAAEKLFSTYGLDRKKIRQLILGTVSGDYPSPPTSPIVAHRLGLEHCGTFDFGAACAGFVTGVHLASALHSATGDQILFCQSEIRSKFLSKEQMNASVLFGDGSSAAWITGNHEGAEFRVLGTELQSDGSIADLISIPAGGSRLPFRSTSDPEQFSIVMKDGAAIFLKAVHGMMDAGTRLISRFDLQWSDVNWVVPHQANALLLREMGKNRTEIADRIFNCISDMGNTSGASVGIALSRLKSAQPLKAGEKLLLISAGGGGVAATALLEALPGVERSVERNDS